MQSQVELEFNEAPSMANGDIVMAIARGVGILVVSKSNNTKGVEKVEVVLNIA